jgi:hypothetical protein
MSEFWFPGQEHLQSHILTMDGKVSEIIHCHGVTYAASVSPLLPIDCCNIFGLPFSSLQAVFRVWSLVPIRPLVGRCLMTFRLPEADIVLRPPTSFCFLPASCAIALPVTGAMVLRVSHYYSHPAGGSVCRPLYVSVIFCRMHVSAVPEIAVALVDTNLFCVDLLSYFLVMACTAGA